MDVGTAILASSLLSGIGGLFSGGQQAKLNKEQLKLQARRLGLDEKQINHLIAQAERMNRIQSHNVGRMNPMLDAMIQRAQEGAQARPDAVRLAPPKLPNNPHAGSAPPPITGVAGLNYGNLAPQQPPLRLPPYSQPTVPQTQDPRDLARFLALGGR